MRERITFGGAALLAGMVLAATPVSADIIGLTPGTYEYNNNDSGSPPVPGTDSLQLTVGSGFQDRSIFFLEAQDITQFSASFTYRATAIGSSGLSRHGLTFCVQNDPAGVKALGDPVFGGLGYAGIENSAAVTIELDTGPDRTYSGFFTDGRLGSNSVDLNPLNAFLGNEIDVLIVYDGLILTVSLTDTVTGASQALPHLVGSLADIVGDSSAYVGFTAGTNTGGANQYLSNFQFTSIPAPGALGLLALAGFARSRRRRS